MISATKEINLATKIAIFHSINYTDKRFENLLTPQKKKNVRDLYK